MGSPALVCALVATATAGCAIGIYSYQHRGAVAAAYSAARAAEGRELAARGLVVAVEHTRAELESEVERLSAQSAGLARALADARRAAPGARAVGVVAASTGPVRALGGPSSKVGRPAREAPGASYEVGCALRYGAIGEIRVNQVELEATGGSRVLVGEASAWRLEPGPPEQVLVGTFRAPLSAAIELGAAAAAPRRWGAGPLAIAGPAGAALGAALAPPPLEVLGLELGLVVGAAVGARGPQGAAAVLVRW